jgi:Replication initiator protein, pSAM2
MFALLEAIVWVCALARIMGERELRQLVRISYAKVAEFQRRGAVHFHAVIRLDAATDGRCPDCLAPPPKPFSADLLEDALKQAVRAVTVPCPPAPGGWRAGPVCPVGEQLDVRNIPPTATRPESCRPSRWPATSPSTPPKPPRASAPVSTGA